MGKIVKWWLSNIGGFLSLTQKHQNMKRIVLIVNLLLAFTGLSLAQTTPSPAKPAKTARTARTATAAKPAATAAPKKTS